jgi:mRNA-degrading endonuclease HigB of HigAB toxin-antitoxin module
MAAGRGHAGWPDPACFKAVSGANVALADAKLYRLIVHGAYPYRRVLVECVGTTHAG